MKPIEETRIDDEADAARFRWLLNGNGYFMEEEYLCGPGRNSEIDKAEARQKIDAEIEAEKRVRGGK